MSKDKRKDESCNVVVKRSKRNFLIYLIPLLVVVFGIGLFAYPILSNWILDKNHSKIVSKYEYEISQESKQDIKNKWKLAKEYNESLAGDPVKDPFVLDSGYAIPDNYMDVLNVAGVMAYIEIPKIGLLCPVYHTSSEKVLEKGIGHIENSFLPIGGESTHSILTGHRGLPGAELFTRLDEMEIGDLFYINVLDDVLCYEVNDVSVIEPYEIQKLNKVNGKDYITLITCTPYGVNTHRLLVRGEQVDYVPPEDTDVSKRGNILGGETEQRNVILGVLIGLGIVFVLAIIFLIVSKIRKRK